MKSAVFFIWMGLLSLGAAELNARIAPLAATYRKQLDEISKRESVKQGEALAVYLDELKAGEEKVTKSGDVKVLAVITKERAAIQAGAPMPVTDPELPRLLQAQRKTYCKAYDEAEGAIAKQKTQLDSKYLAALAKYSAAAATDPALAGQIAEEKKRVMSGNLGPITNLQTQIAGTRWQSLVDPTVIGTFNAEGRYIHWKYTTPDPETVVVHWNENSSEAYKLGKDGKTLFRNGKPDMKLTPAEPAKK
ncbi:MAG: hypothetical protein V4689_07235 [Verrucomicrobiota bacterium]